MRDRADRDILSNKIYLRWKPGDKNRVRNQSRENGANTEENRCHGVIVKRKIEKYDHKECRGCGRERSKGVRKMSGLYMSQRSVWAVEIYPKDGNKKEVKAATEKNKEL